jgi:alkanesulfonate monooxygenase
VITGGSDAEEQKDGDFLEKDDRYRRTDEYIDLLKKTWTAETPFDHDGEFYCVKQAFSSIKPVQQPHIPVFFGGSSDAALEVGARQADVWATWGEPVAAVKEQIDVVRAKAAEYGRSIKISVSIRPIMAAKEEDAWEKAYAYLAKAEQSQLMARAGQSVGSQRLLKFAAEGDVLDKRLFTAIARATGAVGSSTALVGTPDQIAESLLDYYDVGADMLLIRGFDPYQDAIDFGRDLLPVVHAEVKRRDAEAARAIS